MVALQCVFTSPVITWLVEEAVRLAGSNWIPYRSQLDDICASFLFKHLISINANKRHCSGIRIAGVCLIFVRFVATSFTFKL